MPNYEFVETERTFADNSIVPAAVINLKNDFYDVEVSCTENQFMVRVMSRGKQCPISAVIDDNGESIVLIQDMLLANISAEKVDRIYERLHNARESAKSLKRVLDNIDRKWLMDHSFELWEGPDTN